MRNTRYYWFAGAFLLMAVLAVGWLGGNKAAKEGDAIHIRVKDIEGNTVNIDDETPAPHAKELYSFSGTGGSNVKKLTSFLIRRPWMK